MKKFALYLSLLFILSCAKEDSQDPGTTPSNIIPKYTLTASAGEGGSVAPTTGSFNAGTQVSITATPNSGYTFSGWSNGSTANPLTVTLNSNTTVTANFEAIVNSYTLSVSAGEGGSVSSEGGEYEEGTEITLTASASEGYRFIGWSDGSTEESITITLSEDTTLEALFELIPVYTVTVTAEGGVVTGAGEYHEGTEVTITATPDEGYEFVGWTGAIESTELEIQIVVNEAKTISAVFSLITNASDYNPVTQTVLLKIFDFIGEGEYGEPLFSESPTIITVPVVNVEGSRHKIYNPQPNCYKIIELDEENNVVYLDNGLYSDVCHESLPVFKTQVITPSGLSTSINLNYFESFTNGKPLYEYIADYSKHIQGKEIIAVKQQIIGYGNEPLWTPYSDDIAWRSGKLRLPIFHDGNELLSDLAYSKMDSIAYNIELDTGIFKDIKIKYEVDLYENENEIISELNPNGDDYGGFDEMVKGMKGTDAAAYLEEIYLLGGREYLAAAIGGSGVIKFLYKGEKTRDLITHEMGHVWQYRSHIGIPAIDQNEWDALYNSGVFVSNYGMVNPAEFFAEAFMIYWNPNFNNPNVFNPETGGPLYTLPASVEAKLDSYFKN